MTITPVELAAAAFGILGTLLLALNGKRAGWGFVAFIVSNAGWIWFGVQTGHAGLIVQNLVFTGTSLLGVYVWLVKPRYAAGVQNTRGGEQCSD
jgi:nicotinamide riboside transporter PnuC